MNKVVDYLTYGFILLFAGPTVMIMASWNALPGDPMFGIKRASEQILLAIAAPSYETQASLNATYTKRRLEEAKILLANRQSTEGLSQLSAQVRATKAMIESSPDRGKRQEAARKYISTLKDVSLELKTQKVTRAKKSFAIKPITTSRTATQAVVTQNNQQLEQQLDQTTELIDQLRRDLQATAARQQNQQLLSQLNNQATLLQRLQSQLSNTPNQNVIQAAQVQAQIQAQILDHVAEIQQIQEQANETVTPFPTGGIAPPESVPTEPGAIDDAEQQIDDIIGELEELAESADAPPPEPTDEPEPTAIPTAMPEPTAEPTPESSNNHGNGNNNGNNGGINTIINNLNNNDEED